MASFNRLSILQSREQHKEATTQPFNLLWTFCKPPHLLMAMMYEKKDNRYTIFAAMPKY